MQQKDSSVPVISFDNFSFQYRSQLEPTLQQIHLNIYAGEKILIVGPSGSGKSTLGYCLNGIIPFFHAGEISGSLQIKGTETSSMSLYDLSRHVGTVMQDPDGQFIGLTVAEDIAFALENDAIPVDIMRKKVYEMAAIVGMTAYLTASPHDLSGGQKQRVTMAGVMTHNADIMLFDEPLASLDPYTGKTSIEFIQQISQDTNKTMIIIEHRLEEVLHRHIDRVIVMNDGRIVADLPPAELLQSQILSTYGIREPLYITALRYAGVKMTEITHPENINSMDISPIRSQLHAWMHPEPPINNSVEQQPILELQSVNFAFAFEQLVLKDMTFSIQRGEMISIVGNNGAGKSTLSRIICGSIKPQSGEIKLYGQTLANQTVKERASQIGYVMQNPNQMLFKSLVADEVSYGLTLRGLSDIEIKERMLDSLQICGLYSYRNWPIAALSYGQKKRVTIAAVLALNPEILILDEPTAGQDLRHYTEILHYIEKLNRERGLTIMMITHDMHLMLEYSNRALVIADGQLIADQHPAEVLSDLHIIERANLKMTSLYTLAQRAGLPDPKEFIRQFIQHDREERNRNDNVHVILHSS